MRLPCLHYLILVEREFILPKLYSKIIVPSGVLEELGHASAPVKISDWATHPPSWIEVSVPKAIPDRYDVLDFGERQALALAFEINAEMVLLDDKLARRFAQRESMRVKGTLGIVADAARRNLVNFVETVELLQRTSMHLDQVLVQKIIEEYRHSRGH